MAVTDYTSAVDCMFGIALAALNDASQTLGIDFEEIRWPGSDETTTPPQDKYWSRVSEQTVTSGQSSLSVDAGSINQRRFTTLGQMWFQIFCPRSERAAMPNGRQFQQLVLTSLRKSTGDANLWFRNAQAKPVVYNPGNFQFNVVVTYQFDELA